MALSSALHEALREFVATDKGAQCEEARADLGKMDALQNDNVANYEDGAFNVLADLYGLGLGQELPDKATGADSLGVKPE